MKPVAQLQGVGKSYGSGHAAVIALRDINLTLYSGQLTLIQGPSGCGKTTLLEILGLLLPPSKGRVLIHDRLASGMGQTESTLLRRQHVAFVFQDFNLLESLTAHDNIALVAALHGPKASKRTRQVLQTLGLASRGGHRPAELSGGEKQRVAIGRAMVSDASLLLADEPTANLDWSIGQTIVQTLSEISRSQGRSVVVVSHDPRLGPFADRVVSLEDGTIVSQRRAGRAAVSIVALLAVLAAGTVGWMTTINARLRGVGETPPPLSRPAEDSEVVASAPAVIEPFSKTIQLACDRPGIITAIKVDSGQCVARGQILVQLDDTEARAQLLLSQWQYASARAALADLKAWTRPEEIEQARAEVTAATAKAAFADSEYRRLNNLHASGGTSANELDRAKQNLDVARAQLQVAQAALAKDLKGPTPTAVAQAQSRVGETNAAVDVARAALERRSFRSPVDGVVLYVYMRPGEAIDMESPRPVLSLAETGPAHLRADVDEADIGRIFVGQKVLASSESSPSTVSGTVVSMEPMMGRRNVLTNRPRERQDIRIREVVIQLENATQLPIDLMMTVRFLRQQAGGPTTAEK